MTTENINNEWDDREEFDDRPMCRACLKRMDEDEPMTPMYGWGTQPTGNRYGARGTRTVKRIVGYLHTACADAYTNKEGK